MFGLLVNTANEPQTREIGRIRNHIAKARNEEVG